MDALAAWRADELEAAPWPVWDSPDRMDVCWDACDAADALSTSGTAPASPVHRLAAAYEDEEETLPPVLFEELERDCAAFRLRAAQRLRTNASEAAAMLVVDEWAALTARLLGFYRDADVAGDARIVALLAQWMTAGRF
jgi:hypothetical protein